MSKYILCVVAIIILMPAFLLGQVNVNVPDTSVVTGTKTISYPIYVDSLTNCGIYSYQFKINFDDQVINMIGVEVEGTLSTQFMPPVVNANVDGQIEVGSYGVNALTGCGVLIYMIVEIIGDYPDSSVIQVDNFIFNGGNPQAIINNGIIRISPQLVHVNFMANIDRPVQILVDNIPKTIPFDTTWIKASAHSIGSISPQYLSSKERAIFESWSDGGDTLHFIAPMTDTSFFCQMRIEYFLEVLSEFGDVQGRGWYADGSVATILTDSVVFQGDTTRHIFDHWDGTGQNAYHGEQRIASIQISDSLTQVAHWRTQHYLKIESMYGNVNGEGWYDEGQQVNLEIDSLIYSNETKRFVFDSWTGVGEGSYTGALRKAEVIINSPIVETANWTKQFFLFVQSFPDSIYSFSESTWYNEDDTIRNITAPLSINFPEIKYNFRNWLIDTENEYPQNVITVLVDTSHILEAKYQIDSVLVSIETNIQDSMYIFVGENKFLSPYHRFWEYQSEHIIGVDTVRMGTDSLRRKRFESWNDGGKVFHTIKADSVIKIRASFLEESFLSLETNPPGLITFVETGWYSLTDTVILPSVPEKIFIDADTFRFKKWEIDFQDVAKDTIKLSMNVPHSAVAYYNKYLHISGFIKDGRGVSVSGVKLVVTGFQADTLKSSVDGFFIFDAMQHGNYTIIPFLENYRFEPVSRSYTDIKDSFIEQNFTAIDILPPSVSIIKPIGGEQFEQGTIDTIYWEAKDNVGIDSVAIELSIDNGKNWTSICRNLFEGNNFYLWGVPDFTSNKCLIRIQVTDYDGNFAVDSSDSVFSIVNPSIIHDDCVEKYQPNAFLIFQNYPNPFNSSTMIPYYLPRREYVKIVVYNLKGQMIRVLLASEQDNGSHLIAWNGNDDNGSKVSAGIYLIRFQSSDISFTKKVLHVK